MMHIRAIIRISSLLFLTLVLLVLAMPAQAQEGDISDDDVNEIAKDIYCPVCESTPLDVCGTKACSDWRELIREKLGDGQSKDEIFNYFARQYGDGVLANPPSRGLSLVILWVLPIVLVLVGLLLFIRYMGTLRSQQTETGITDGAPPVETETGPTSMETSGESQDDYYSRIEEELNKN